MGLLMDAHKRYNSKDYDEHLPSPMLTAIERGHVGVVRELMRRGWPVRSSWNRDVPVQLAARIGNVEMLKTMLESGVDLRKPDLALLLYEATKNKDVEVARHLLGLGLDVDNPEKIYDTPDRTPLHVAAGEGNAGVVELLLSKGAKVDARDRFRGSGTNDGEGRTPLHYAASNGNAAVARLLLDLGADVAAGDSEMRTPLHNAARGGHIEMARLLLDRGADVDAADKSGRTPMCDAIGVPGGNAISGRRMLLLLISRGGNVNTVDRGGQSVLNYAITRRSFTASYTLVRHGASVNFASGLANWDEANTNKSFAAALPMAIHSYSPELAVLFVRHGADVNARTSRGNTPLASAAWWGQEGLVKYLLRHGADPNLAGGSMVSTAIDTGGGLTALMAAPFGYGEIVHATTPNTYGHGSPTGDEALANERSVGVIRALLKAGAKVNARSTIGCTALHTAVQTRAVGVVKELIDAGADVNAASLGGLTPMHMAMARGNIAAARLLLDKGAKINAADACGWAPLHVAAHSGNALAVSSLIAVGADIHARANEPNEPLQGKDTRIKPAGGLTPLHLAARRWDGKEAMEALLAAGADVRAKDSLGRTPLDAADPRNQDILRKAATQPANSTSQPTSTSSPCTTSRP